MAYPDPFTQDPASSMDAGFDVGLSYERDIAPLQQRFFRQIYGNRSISPTTRAALSTGISQQLAGAFEQQAKLRDIDQQARNRELSFRTGLFSLDQARERALKERENAMSLGGVVAELTSITDAGLDADTQRSQLSNWGIRNAGLLSTNDAARVAYNSALQAAPKTQPGFTEEELIRAGAPLDELDTNKDGVLSPEERNPMNVSRVVVGRRQKAAEAEEAVRRQRTAETARQKIFDATLSQLGGVRFKKQKPLNPDEPEIELPEFADTSARSIVDNVISLGTPAEQAAAQKAANDRERFAIASTIQNRYLRERLTGLVPESPNAAPAPQSLFATPPAK